jgi:hypothetical protein
MRTDSLTIAQRFRGPPPSGNGGSTCGCLARHIEGPVSVRLMAPPPVDRPLRVEASDEVARLWDGATQIAEARPSTFAIEVPAVPSFDEATTASRGYTGLRRHPFPGCFVCGPQRAAGDGMHLYAGPLDRDGIVATPWVPAPDLCSEGVVRSEFMWAALDCPGAFAVMPEDLDRAIVLGQIEVRITGSIAAGTRCVVIGWPISIEGRKRIVGTAIVDADGAIVAHARATWIEVPASAFPAADGSVQAPGVASARSAST